MADTLVTIPDIDNMDKWYLSAITAAIFYILSHPTTYSMITGPIFEDLFDIKLHKNGKPTQVGLLVHTVIFLIVIRLLMELKLV